MSITVIGAGMAGLLAGAMLRSECEGILEKNSSLPANHSAVLRFRTSAVSDVTNIPFKRVSVMKTTEAWLNPVADALSYSHKNTGFSTLRSITSARSEVEQRYIAPPNFIEQLAERVSDKIEFGAEASSLMDYAPKEHPTISTMPMPVLMKMLGWKDVPPFRSVDGVNVTATIADCDAYASVYVPQPEFPASRISITGDQLICECPLPEGNPFDTIEPIALAQAAAARILGIGPDRLTNIEIKKQRFAKILPIDENVRRRFILWASEHHNIYSLGRFATWRPGLVLDDIVNDVRVIHRLINGGSAYHHKKGN